MPPESMVHPEFEADRSPHAPREGGGALVVEEFETFRELVERCASRLSRQGCFLEGPGPEPVGTHVTFLLGIRDGFAVLRGEGEVVGAGGLEAEESPSGMAVRFLRLDEASQKLLPSLLGHYRRRGIEPYELPAAGALPPAPATREAAAAEVGPAELTLSELEHEFRPAERPAREAAPESALTPVGEPAVADPESPVPGEAGTVAETGADLSEEPERRRPLLVPAGDLTAPESAGGRSGELEQDLTEVADEVRLADLAPVEIPDGEPGAPRPGESAEPPAVDPGLSWLPDEPRRGRGKGLWLVLLLVLLGIVLAAAVYYLLVRGPREPGDEGPFDPQRSGVGREVSELAEVELASSDLPAVSRSATDPTGVSMLAATVESVEPEDAATPPDRAAAEPEIPEAGGSELTGIDRITWTEQDGSTVLILWADGEFRLEQIEQERIGGPSPRDVVKIRGVTRPCPEQRVEVGTAHVRRVRTGHHPETAVAELHIVTDLVDGDVELRTEADGAQLRFYFSRTG